MESISKQLSHRFIEAIRQAFPQLGTDVDPMVQPSQNEKFGDYQSNAAMGLSKSLSAVETKTNPRAVAELIKSKLDVADIADGDVTIAGPGFINLFLAKPWLGRLVNTLRDDVHLGLEKTLDPKTVIVEYSSPNIAKQMHVGHIRTTIIGDALARVFELIGHNVIRQNHIGDWGTQFGKVILSIWHLCMAEHIGDADWPARTGKRLFEAKNNPAVRAAIVAETAQQHQKYLDADPTGTDVFGPYLNRYEPRLDVIEPIYQFVSAVEESLEAKSQFITDRSGNKASLADQSKVITSMLQQRHDQETNAWRKVRAATLDACQKVYARLGVELELTDVRGESDYDADLRPVVDELRELNLAEESDGAIVVFIDGREKSPLIIEKSKGHGFLYATTDLAAIRYRAKVLKADRVLYVVDSRQSQHFRQVFETAKRAGWGAGTTYEHAAFGTVLGADGKPMKTREGDNIKLADLLDEAEYRGYQLVSEKATERGIEVSEANRRAIGKAVGIGAIKYADLSKDRTTDYVFSWDTMLATVGNTGPYLQYAFARICSIFRKAEINEQNGVVAIESLHEKSLVKQIVRFQDTIELVARELKPHHLCSYLYDLATLFSAFYENCPVLKSEGTTRQSRLALCKLTARTLSTGLDLLGIEHPEQM